MELSNLLRVRDGWAEIRPLEFETPSNPMTCYAPKGRHITGLGLGLGLRL